MTWLLNPKQEACRESERIIAPTSTQEREGKRTRNTYLMDPSLDVASSSSMLGVILTLSGIDGGPLTCKSSNMVLSISSEKQHSALPAALIGAVTMLSPRVLVTGRDLGSPSLLSRLGRLTLTSFDETGRLAPTDDTAVVGTALLSRLSLYGSFSALLE